MKAVILDGVEYDATLQPFTGDLRLLKKQCGIGFDVIVQRLSGMEGADMVALLGDEEFLEAFLAWLWLLRLRAGERDLTFEQAGLIALDTVQFVADDEAEAVEVDPKAGQPVTGQDASAGAAAV